MAKAAHSAFQIISHFISQYETAKWKKIIKNENFSHLFGNISSLSLALAPTAVNMKIRERNFQWSKKKSDFEFVKESSRKFQSEKPISATSLELSRVEWLTIDFSRATCCVCAARMVNIYRHSREPNSANSVLLKLNLSSPSSSSREYWGPRGGRGKEKYKKKKEKKYGKVYLRVEIARESNPACAPGWLSFVGFNLVRLYVSQFIRKNVILYWLAIGNSETVRSRDNIKFFTIVSVIGYQYIETRVEIFMSRFFCADTREASEWMKISMSLACKLLSILFFN